MNTVAMRKFSLILGLAFASLFFAPQQAVAGLPELKALVVQLGGSLTDPITGKAKTEAQLTVFVQTQTSADIADAVVALINTKPTSAAKYAGEALKRADETDFGTVLGQKLVTANQAGIFNAFPGDPVKTAAAKAKFIGTAAKNAATGSGAFAEWIDEFARELTATNQDVYDAAKYATASKTAVGLIISSRALDADINTDAKRLDLARTALLPPSVGGRGYISAVQEVARYVGAYADDAADFTHDLVATTDSNLKQPLLSKLQFIVTGTVTSNPTEASDIVATVFEITPPADLTILSTQITPVFTAAVKNAAKLAKSLGLVADAEQVEAIGAELGSRVGLVANINGKFKVVGIASTQVAAIAKGLTLGLTNRSTLPADLRGLTQLQIDYLKLANSRTNRLDEIGEVGAYLFNSLKNLQVFQAKDLAGTALIGTKLTAAQKQATALVTSLMKTIITSSAKVYNDGAAAINPKKAIVKDPIFQATVAEDLAGGMALTLRSLQGVLDPNIYSALITALTADTIGTKIAGGNKTLFTIDLRANKTIAQLVHDALHDVLTDSTTDLAVLDTTYKRYENGTNPNYAMGPYNENPGRGLITEPETDIRIH